MGSTQHGRYSQGMGTVVNATDFTCRPVQVGPDAWTVSLVRRNGPDSETTKHGKYTKGDAASLASGIMTTLLSQTIAGRNVTTGEGFFTDDDVRQAHQGAEARLLGQGHHEMA